MASPDLGDSARRSADLLWVAAIDAAVMRTLRRLEWTPWDLGWRIVQVIDTGRPSGVAPKRWSWSARGRLWWATVVQFAGTFWYRASDDPAWWSSLLNYVGSVFFMVSAIVAFTLTTTGEAVNTALVNSGTYVGAICFLIGAYLLLPSARTAPRSG
jgi:hypothetical protein